MKTNPAQPKHTLEPWLTGQPEIGYTHDINDLHFEYATAILPLDDYDRAITCVNALAGVTDPAAALAQVRDRINSAILAAIDGGASEHDEVLINLRAALLLLPAPKEEA